MKKREVLPALNKCIEALVAMSADCAKLELMDNDKASRRLKLSVSDFKSGELKEFQDLIFKVRSEISSKGYKKKSPAQREIVTEFLNNNNQ